MIMTHFTAVFESCQLIFKHLLTLYLFGKLHFKASDPTVHISEEDFRTGK